MSLAEVSNSVAFLDCESGVALRLPPQSPTPEAFQKTVAVGLGLPRFFLLPSENAEHSTFNAQH
jgi:hypothetical protein